MLLSKNTATQELKLKAENLQSISDAYMLKYQEEQNLSLAKDEELLRLRDQLRDSASNVASLENQLLDSRVNCDQASADLAKVQRELDELSDKYHRDITSELGSQSRWIISLQEV